MTKEADTRIGKRTCMRRRPGNLYGTGLKTRYKFYAMLADGETLLLDASYEAIISAISDQMVEDEEATYTIERVDGLYNFIQRMGSIESYSDEWMEQVLEVTHGIVSIAREKREEAKADTAGEGTSSEDSEPEDITPETEETNENGF